VLGRVRQHLDRRFELLVARQRLRGRFDDAGTLGLVDAPGDAERAVVCVVIDVREEAIGRGWSVLVVGVDDLKREQPQVAS
jgi:hypothetical protein